MNLLEQNLTYKLQGGLFDVQNEVGLGRSEEIYHQAFCHWLTENQISFRTKPVYPITLDGVQVLDLIPDLIVEERLVIELKAKPHHLADQDTVQLYNYLKRTGIALGLLVNLGLDRVTIKRHLHDATQTKLKPMNMGTSVNAASQRLQASLLQIYAEHKTGYSSSIMDRVLHNALRVQGLNVTHCPSVVSFYGNHPLGKSPLDCFVVNDEVVLCHTCLYDDNEFNASRTRSFLEALNLKHGLAVNFGKCILEAQFYG